MESCGTSEKPGTVQISYRRIFKEKIQLRLAEESQSEGTEVMQRTRPTCLLPFSPASFLSWADWAAATENRHCWEDLPQLMESESFLL